MLNLLSENYTGRFGTSALLLRSTGIVLLPPSSVK
jgi:hypothetical protein